MSTPRSTMTDPLLTEALGRRADGPHTPADLLDDVLTAVGGTSQARAWGWRLPIMKRPKAIIAVAALVAATILAVASAAGGQGETDTAGLVTEEVEPGVERIRSDGAGHDLEERHPTFRYDMDDVFVAPDGTVWVSSTYHGSDNAANPQGGLVWALGQSETPQYSVEVFCFPGDIDRPEASGVTCLENDTPTRYLVGTKINAVAAAPDGTYWAVGNDGAENGGLYHITP